MSGENQRRKTTKTLRIRNSEPKDRKDILIIEKVWYWKELTHRDPETGPAYSYSSFYKETLDVCTEFHTYYELGFQVREPK